jgi:predicted NBD/HSP70 family sugar kinase
MIDVGGTNVKLLTRQQPEMVKFPSGSTLAAQQMVERTLELTQGWGVTEITMGFPGLVKDNRPVREPLNLGGGWFGYDFERAFGCPVTIINDAALQALAAYSGEGRMLFVGFGTSIGCALAADGCITNVELGLIPMGRDKRFMDRLSKAARNERGQRKWERDALTAIALLRDIFWPDVTVIGGGNGKHIEELPEGCMRTNNAEAILGAERMWPGADLRGIPCGGSIRI